MKHDETLILVEIIINPPPPPPPPPPSYCGPEASQKAANKCSTYVGTSLRLLEQRHAEFAKQQEQTDLLRISLLPTHVENSNT